MATRCEVENCLEDAIYEVTNEETDGEYPVCRRCAEEILARPGIYSLRHLSA